MKLGELYSAPWGRYVVHREGPPVVLRSLERAAACIIDPCPRDYERAGVVGSDPVPVQTEPLNGCQTGAARSERRSEVRAVEQSSANGPAEEERHQPPPGLPAAASPHAGPWRPGVNALRARGLPSWSPCLTRERDDAGAPLAHEHAWFLDDGGSLYCWECRRAKPITVIGPAPWIAEVRAAVAAGDIVLAHELVRLGPCSAPRASGPSPSAIVDGAVDDNGCDAHRDLKPENVVIAPAPSEIRPASPALVIAPAPRFRPRDLADWREFFTERAAIAEYVGGMLRDDAEALAADLAGPQPQARSAA